MLKITIVQLGTKPCICEVPEGITLRELFQNKDLHDQMAIPNISHRVAEGTSILFFNGKVVNLDDNIVEDGSITIGSSCRGEASLSEEELTKNKETLEESKKILTALLDNSSTSENNEKIRLLVNKIDNCILWDEQAIDQFNSMYTWSGRIEDREKVFKCLTEKGYLREEPKTFYNRFRIPGEPTDLTIKPLNWRGPIQQLAETIHTLIHLNMIANDPNGKEGILAAEVFLIKGKNVKLSSSIAQTKDTFQSSVIFHQLQKLLQLLPS